MELIVLGSGTGQPTVERGPAGYVVHAGGEWMIFDFGPGSMHRLVRAGLDYKAIDTVFLSHHHADHCADLVALLFATNWSVAERQRRPLRIIGPAGTRRLVDGLCALYPSLKPETWEPVIEEWERGQTGQDAWRVTSVPVEHGNVSAVAYRIESDGRTLVYSGDTGECDGIVEAASGADLLLVECSFPEGKQTRSHLVAPAAGRVASKADAKRVMLTHFYPECEDVDVVAQCATQYAGAIEKARDLLRVTV